MPNFELLFQSTHHGRLVHKGPYDGLFKRVIVVDDFGIAQAVAKAMLGEEVEAKEHLYRVMKVLPTDQAPAIYVFDEGRYCWSEVLKKLKIHPDTIEFIYADVNGMRERVGFTKIKTALI